MKPRIIALIIAGVFLAMLTAVAQRVAVTATTGGVQAQPTNYWDANRASISNALTLGNSSTRNVGTSAGTVAAGDDSRITGAVQTTRSLLTTGSLTGGGTLASDRTLLLSGDADAPGNSRYYGTDSGGTKGFYLLPLWYATGTVATNLKVGSNIVLTITGSEATIDMVTNPVFVRIDADTLALTDPLGVASGGTGGTNAAQARANLDLEPGTDVQAYDADLGALAGLSTTGLVQRTGSGTASIIALPGGTTTYLRADGTFATPAGGTNVFSYDIDSSGSTTNDSTAVTLSTTGIATDSIVTVDADVFGGGQTNGASYRLLATYRNVGGTVTTVGTNNLSTIESVANLHAWPEVSGTNLLFKVKGQTNENINWFVKGRVLAGTLATNAAAAGCTTAIDSLTTASVGNKPVGQYSDSDWVGSEFTAANTATVCTIKLKLYAIGSPSGNLTARIYTESSGVPGTQVGTASDAVAASSVPGTYTVITFENVSASITSGTKYFVVLENSVVNASNYIGWDAVSLTGNTAKSADGSSWSDYASDRGMYFELFSP